MFCYDLFSKRSDEQFYPFCRFCCNHGSEHTSKKKTVPEEMIALAKFIIPKLILKMYDDLKTIRSESKSCLVSLVTEADIDYNLWEKRANIPMSWCGTKSVGQFSMKVLDT